MAPETSPAETAEWKEQAAEVFRSTIAVYEVEREQQFFFRTQIDIVRQLMHGAHGRLLAIGCAAGGEIPPLRAMGFELVGIDIVDGMLRSAQQRFSADPGVTFCQADIEHLPFADGSFDHVLCLGVLEYVPAYGPSVAEMNRVVRPGGRVLISVPSRLSAYETSLRWAEASVAPAVRFAKRVVQRVLGRPASAGNVPRHHRNLCHPDRLRELLSTYGFTPGGDAFTAFFFYPLDRLSQTVFESLARVLEPLRTVPGVRRLASQYLVVAEKHT
jgi:ubiquinone/menaquinone biosynthesis C-methylase UbiE